MKLNIYFVIYVEQKIRYGSTILIEDLIFHFKCLPVQTIITKTYANDSFKDEELQVQRMPAGLH